MIRKEEIIHMIQGYVDGKLDNDGVNAVESMFEKGEEDTVLKSVLEKEWRDLVGKDIVGKQGHGAYITRCSCRDQQALIVGQQRSCARLSVYAEIAARISRVFAKETVGIYKHTGWRENKPYLSYHKQLN